MAGKIPDIPVGTPNENNVPTYGTLNGAQMPVCSATYKCRLPGQIWDAPAGKIGVGFDDGPLPVRVLSLRLSRSWRDPAAIDERTSATYGRD